MYTNLPDSASEAVTIRIAANAEKHGIDRLLPASESESTLKAIRLSNP